MILLVEQYAYDASKLEKSVLRVGLPSRGKLTLDQVGYFRATTRNTCSRRVSIAFLRR